MARLHQGLRGVGRGSRLRKPARPERAFRRRVFPDRHLQRRRAPDFHRHRLSHKGSPRPRQFRNPRPGGGGAAAVRRQAGDRGPRPPTGRGARSPRQGGGRLHGRAAFASLADAFRCRAGGGAVRARHRGGSRQARNRPASDGASRRQFRRLHEAQGETRRRAAAAVLCRAALFLRPRGLPGRRHVSHPDEQIGLAFFGRPARADDALGQQVLFHRRNSAGFAGLAGRARNRLQHGLRRARPGPADGGHAADGQNPVAPGGARPDPRGLPGELWRPGAAGRGVWPLQPLPDLAGRAVDGQLGAAPPLDDRDPDRRLPHHRGTARR